MASSSDDNTVPPVAVGHVRMDVKDVGPAADWFVAMGLRKITTRDSFAVLELRGGTHLVLRQTDEEIVPGALAPIDLMFDDLDAAHDDCAARGLAPGEIGEGSVHRSFHVPGPDGYSVKITSSHTGGRAV
jgi:hypothetical protein